MWRVWGCTCILNDENKGRRFIDSEYSAQKQVIGSLTTHGQQQK